MKADPNYFAFICVPVCAEKHRYPDRDELQVLKTRLWQFQITLKQGLGIQNGKAPEPCRNRPASLRPDTTSSETCPPTLFRLY